MDSRFFAIAAIALVLLSSGCLEKPGIRPDTIPTDREGKTSTFSITGLSKCNEKNMIFSVKNTGDERIDFPIIFVDSVWCTSIPLFGPGEEYRVSCPSSDHLDTFKQDFVDGKTYTVKMEAMTNTQTITCDYSVWFPE